MLICLLGFVLKHSILRPIFSISDLVVHATIFRPINFSLVPHQTTLIFAFLDAYAIPTPLPLLLINFHPAPSLVFSSDTLLITVDTAAMIRSVAVC